MTTELKPFSFDLELPTRLEHAVSLLQEHEGSLPLAGGQSLVQALNLRELRVTVLVDVTRLRELRGCQMNGVLRIGAAEPMWKIEHHPLVMRHAPLLVHALGTVGAPSIRSRATLGGSAAWSDPTSQLPATMLALEAELLTTRRRLAAEALFEGPRRTVLERDELIIAIEFSSSATGAGYGLRHVRRTHITWPVVGCVATVRFEAGVVRSARIAIYGGGERPLLAEDAAETLVDAAPTAELIEEVALRAAAGAQPRSDERASAAYRRDVLPVLIRRALADAIKRA